LPHTAEAEFLVGNFTMVRAQITMDEVIF
jgi:hypothetical protein